MEHNENYLKWKAERAKADPPQNFASRVMEQIHSNKSYRIQIFNSSGINSSADFAETTVPDMHFFVMGDNRANSLDSRFWGPVPLADILGKIDFIYFPAESWSRFGGFPN